MHNHIGFKGELTVIEHQAERVLTPLELEHALACGDARVIAKTSNLILDSGLSALSRFLGNNAGAPLVGGVGFSSTDDLTVGEMLIGNHPSPQEPTAQDTTAALSPRLTLPVTVTYPTETSIQFEALVAISESNGISFSEEALILRNGVIFAKTTITPPKLKTSANAVQFNHRISIGRL